MKPIGCLLALMGTVALWSCSTMKGPPEEVGRPGHDILSIPLTPTTYSAGRLGRAVLVAQGEMTAVTIEVSGVPDYVTRPVHLYTFIHRGACGNLDPEPAYSLNDRVLASFVGSADRVHGIGTRGPFKVVNVAPVPLEVLRRSSHAIQVQTSPADGSFPIMCGNIA